MSSTTSFDGARESVMRQNVGFPQSGARHLGNFPEAFSHLALVEAAARIILAETVTELATEPGREGA